MVNRSLVLSETVDGDNDRYFCVASNAAGNVSRDFQLVVQGAYNYRDHVVFSTGCLSLETKEAC